MHKGESGISGLSDSNVHNIAVLKKTGHAGYMIRPLRPSTFSFYAGRREVGSSISPKTLFFFLFLPSSLPPALPSPPWDFCGKTHPLPLSVSSASRRGSPLFGGGQSRKRSFFPFGGKRDTPNWRWWTERQTFLFSPAKKGEKRKQKKGSSPPLPARRRPLPQSLLT